MFEKNLSDRRMTSGAGSVSNILRDVISRRDAGENIPDHQVITEHSEAGTELTERLRALRLIERAERQARSGPFDDSRRGEPDAVPDSLLRRDAFPGYDIQSEIHRGGQGLVYLAIQQATQKPVAIKVLRNHRFAANDARVRFDREVQVLRRLQHPNIVTIHDSGMTGAAGESQADAGACYLVMDYIAGRSLDDYLASRIVSLRTILQLFAQIAWAVHAAHVRGIIHRDLKPSNIRIDDAGEPHILDFGLAKLAGSAVDEAPPAATMTLTGQFVGSLPWASPEQAEGAARGIDSRCDIYALGVMLYQALTGRFPYPVNGTFAEVLHHILRTEPVPPGKLRPDVNDELDTIVLKCLAKDLQRRYQSAAELARDIERLLAGEPIEARRDSAWYLIRSMIRRHRLATAAALSVFALACGSAIWLSVLYRAEARARADAERSVQRAGVIQHFLQSMLVQVRPPQARPGDSAARRQLIAREVLDDAATRVETQLVGQPEVEAAVRTIIGRAYHGMGLFAEAQPHLRRALEIRQTLLPAVHPDLAASLNHLGELRYDLDDFAGAETLFRRALEQRRQLYPGGHPDLAESLRNLGWVLQTRRQYAQVEPLYAESLGMMRAFSGNDSIEAAGLLGRWGQLEFAQNHFDAATARLVEARGMLQRLGADQTPQTAALLIQLGKIEEAVGRIPEAESLLREALELARRVHGDVHPDVAWSLQRLGMLLRIRGCYAQAEPVLREACEINAKLLSQDSPYLARSYECLAALLLDRGDLDGAQNASQTAVAVWSRRYRPDDPCLTWCRGQLGCVLAARGDFDAAKPLLTLALEQRDTVLADESEQVVANLCALAAIHRAHGRPDRAIARLTEALEIIQTWSGQGAPQAVVVKSGLGRVLTETGDLPGAGPFLAEALILARQRLGEDHPATALCLHNMALWFAAQYEARFAIPFPAAAEATDAASSFMTALERARHCAGDALTIRQRALPFDHPAIAESRLLFERMTRAGDDRSGIPVSPGESR